MSTGLNAAEGWSRGMSEDIAGEVLPLPNKPRLVGRAAVIGFNCAANLQ
jgi:hypothetical protein